MNATRNVKLKDISGNLTCNLCKGYMIDATTTIECLHSFCKSCIVKHLDNSEYCPVCDVQLHSTRPLEGIRQDQMLQEIIYKLVPGLFTREMERRRKFYEKHPESTPTSQMDAGQVYHQPYITSDDKINLSLEYFSNEKSIQDCSRRYFHCPAGVSISIIKKLIHGKHDLPKDAQVEVLFGERILPDDFLLMDIAYKYSWTEKMKTPLQLRYRLRDYDPQLPESSNTLTFIPAIRGSRSLTDSDILKIHSPNVQSAMKNGVGATPNGKLEKRKKKNSSVISNNDSPRLSRGKKSQFLSSEAINGLNSATGSPSLTAPKEVHLHITETGIMSAKSVASGEEKIIKPKENGTTGLKLDVEGISLTYQTIIGNAMEQQNSANTVSHSTPLKANGSSTKPTKKKKIGTVNGDAKSSINGKSLQKKEKVNSDSKKSNVQKAIEDLKKNHIKALKKISNLNNGGSSKTKVDAPTPSPKNGLNSDIPLPFPLSALAFSGMTVNVIPSSELNKPSVLKGKELLPSSPPSTPQKPSKHQVSIVNGSKKFASPKPILASTGMTPNGHATSPPKPRKFFKSRQPSTSEENAEKSDIHNNSIEKRNTKSPSPSTTSMTTSTGTGGGAVISSSPSATTTKNGVLRNHLCDMKPIDSAISRKSGTITTPSSRMATMTTTTSTLPVTNSFVPMSPIANQYLQFYANAMQLQYGIPLTSGLPTFMANNYNPSLSFSNSRPVIDPSMHYTVQANSGLTTFPYSANQFFSSTVPVYSGITEKKKPDNTAASLSQYTEPSSTKRKMSNPSNSSESLDLSIKKSKKDVETKSDKQKEKEIPVVPNCNGGPEMSKTSEESAPIVPNSQVKNDGSKKPLDSMNGQKEEKITSGTSKSPEKDVMKNEESTKSHDRLPIDPIDPTPTPNSTLEKSSGGQPETNHYPTEDSNSNDSSGLVINEDAAAKQPTSPSSETKDKVKVNEEIRETEAKDVVISCSTITNCEENGNEELNRQGDLKDGESIEDMKKNSICNNNNDPPAADSSSASIPLDKLSSEESSTGA